MDCGSVPDFLNLVVDAIRGGAYALASGAKVAINNMAREGILTELNFIPFTRFSQLLCTGFVQVLNFDCRRVETW